MTILCHLNTFHSHTFTSPNDLSRSPDELHPFQQFSCAPQSSCNHAMPLQELDLMNIMMQDKRSGSMDRVQELSDCESLSSDEERDFLVSGCVSRVNTFGSRGGRIKIGSRMMSRASTFGLSRANTMDDHQLPDAMDHMQEELQERITRKMGREEEEEESEEVPLGHLAHVYLEMSTTSYLTLAGDDGDDKRWFTPSGPSLGIFCACRHHQLGRSLMTYEVTRKWAIFGFCRLKSEMETRRELFLPFQARWLLREEGMLWEGIKDITVGRHVRRVRKRLGQEVREEGGVMKRWAKVVAGKLPSAFGCWLGVRDEEGQEEDIKADDEQDVNHEARINDLEGDEYDEGPPNFQEGQRTATCALCHLTEIVDSTLPMRHPGFLECGSAPSRETDRGCRSVADRLYTENGNRRIRPVPRGLRRAAGGGDDDDGVNDNSGAGDGGGHRDGTVAAERVVGPRPAHYEIDPSPPVLKYEDYTAYDVVLRLFGSEHRSDLAWNNSYVDLNMEMGLLKDYKEHVEEKIDFSDEERARKEYFYLELQREIEIDLKECAVDLGRNIIRYEKTLDDYKALARDVHFELQKELRERYGRYETPAIRDEYQNGKRPSQRTP